MTKFYYQRSIALGMFFLLALGLLAQPPKGYYDRAAGKKERALKTAMFQIINEGFNKQSYGSGKGSTTWSAFEKMDKHPDGYVWDMYSTSIRYFPGNGGVPSGMNIEHSMPKSWWGGGKNQAYCDVLQLRPSDSGANSRKSNYVMSVVNVSGAWDNGAIKVGKTTLSGGSINAWEPADEYKGDFARIYMYMVTCYEDFGSSKKWTSEGLKQLDNNTYPVFKQWTIDLLLDWNEKDPVSEKEITLNEEGYKIQQNRNPFIDFPDLAEYIWGDRKDEAFYPDAEEETRTSSPTFSVVGGTYKDAFDLTLDCITEGAKIYYTLDGTEPNESSTLYLVPIRISAKSTTVKAIAYAEGKEASRVKTSVYLIGVEPNTATSIKDMRNFYTNNSDKTVYTLELNDVSVICNEGKFLFLQDVDAAIVVYGTNTAFGHLKAGDVLSGKIAGTLSDYNSMLEIMNAVATDLKVVRNEEVTPVEVTVEELKQNFSAYDSRFIYLENVSFADRQFTNNNVNISQGGQTIVCRNHFNKVTVALPVLADLQGVAIKHYDAIQIALRGNDDILPAGSTSIGVVQGDKLKLRSEKGKILVLTDDLLQVTVYDITGRIVKQQLVRPGTTELSLSAGLYIINGIKVVVW